MLGNRLLLDFSPEVFAKSPRQARWGCGGPAAGRAPAGSVAWEISVAACAECHSPVPPQSLPAQTPATILFPDKALVG